MNCKWCDKLLNDRQVYDFLRSKSKGTSCSSKCSMMILNYGCKENLPKCKTCGKPYNKPYKTNHCSLKCTGKTSSIRMKENNPMRNNETRIKVSNKLKEINHKPIIQGGNGKGATIEQLNLYNEIIKFDNSFQLEFIIKTGNLRKVYNSPTHYKCDIASDIHKLVIEIDGNSHNSIKIRECDKKKTQVLNLKGWKVLRLSNFQIQTELQSCVQMVMSMI
jgi:hypothetical protein